MTPDESLAASQHIHHQMMKAFKDGVAAYNCAIPFDLINWAAAMTFVNMVYSTGTPLEDAFKLIEKIYNHLDQEVKRAPH